MKKILIVDDEPDIVKVLAMRLKDRGFEISTASSAEQAFIQIKNNKPDLIIFDIVLPGMQGNEAAKKLKEDPQTSTIPVILVSALQVDEAKDKSEELILTKPFNFSFLLKKIEELTGPQ